MTDLKQNPGPPSMPLFHRMGYTHMWMEGRFVFAARAVNLHYTIKGVYIE